MTTVEPDTQGDQPVVNRVQHQWQWGAAHGGAGVTTLAALEERGREGVRGAWDMALPVVVVCRTSASGLVAARELATALPAHGGPVVGLLTIADTPGRLPKGLVQLRRHVTGGFACAWHIDWVEQWRCGEPVSPANTPRKVRSIMRQVSTRVDDFHAGRLVMPHQPTTQVQLRGALQ